MVGFKVHPSIPAKDRITLQVDKAPVLTTVYEALHCRANNFRWFCLDGGCKDSGGKLEGIAKIADIVAEEVVAHGVGKWGVAVVVGITTFKAASRLVMVRPKKPLAPMTNTAAFSFITNLETKAVQGQPNDQAHPPPEA